MNVQSNERCALFIDGANLYAASRHLGFDVDYRSLLLFWRKRANVVRANYYSALLDTEEYSPLKPLTDWLAYRPRASSRMRPGAAGSRATWKSSWRST